MPEMWDNEHQINETQGGSMMEEEYKPIHAFCGGIFVETGTCDIMSGEVSTYKCAKCGYETDASNYEMFQRHWDNKPNNLEAPEAHPS